MNKSLQHRYRLIKLQNTVKQLLNAKGFYEYVDNLHH
jgi:hypothetical protein